MRLTKKETSDYIHNKFEKIRNDMKDNVGACEEMAYIETNEQDELRYEKLGQLEDIEEELGIDLITLFKALRYGVYVKPEYNCFDLQKGNISFLSSTKLAVDGFGTIAYKPYEENSYNQFHFSFKNYGKTWALTKEELL